jgi:hypothetical protein
MPKRRIAGCDALCFACSSSAWAGAYTDDLSATGVLFTRLLTDSCKLRAQKALRFERPATLQLGFRVLGQVAGVELLSNPAVTQNMAGLEKYLDSRKLEALHAEPLPGG